MSINIFHACLVPVALFLTQNVLGTWMVEPPFSPADFTSAPTHSVGNTNFRSKLLFSHPQSSGLTTTTINDSGKQNCPNKAAKGHG